ncbi:unnamed protein product, partial [Polarella glacialis]
MARLSKLSRQLRRAFECEHPGVHLDDDVAEYFAGMLEDDADLDDGELAEAWAPFLGCLGRPGAPKDLCAAVLQRLKARETVGPGAWKSGERSPASSPQLSRESSATGAPGLPAAAPHLALGVAAASGSPLSPAVEEEVKGLNEWLERLCLSQYRAPARAWCAGMGAVGVEEVFENWEEFSDALGLKFLEKRRVRLDCAARGIFTPRRARTESEDDADEDAEEGEGVAQDATNQRIPPQESGHPTVLGQRLGQRKKVSRSDTFGHPESPYTFLEEIGSGVTATVYKCSRGSEFFAVKAISLSRFRMTRDYAGVLERLRRESAILFSMRHSHVVSLFDVFETPERLLLVMEFVGGGELLNDIVQHGTLPEHEVRYVFLQIVLGLRYIHSKGVVHRDLKPENVLIDREGSRPGLLEVKISDFGHSKLVNDGYSTALSQVGTPHYWAPEVADASAGSYDERVDLWSLGVVLYVMLEGRYPFAGANCTASAELPFQESRGSSPLARHLLRSLIQIRPQELTLRCKFPVTLRLREVALCFTEAHAKESVEAAWQELLGILTRHLPGSSLRHSEAAVGVGPAAAIGMAPVPESEGSANVFSEAGLARQDAELEAATAAFPEVVEAATGSWAPIPRRADVRLRAAGQTLELMLELPS